MLVGQTSDQAIASYIAGGEYPDFISGNIDLYEANALIPVDEYWMNTRICAVILLIVSGNC